MARAKKNLRYNRWNSMSSAKGKLIFNFGFWRIYKTKYTNIRLYHHHAPRSTKQNIYDTWTLVYTTNIKINSCQCKKEIPSKVLAMYNLLKF